MTTNNEIDYLATLFKVKRNFHETQLQRERRENKEFFKGKCEAYTEMIAELENLKGGSIERDTAKPKRPFD